MAPLINFSGIASGIDTNSLITAILDQQRKSQITPLQNRIDSLTKTNDVFGQLSELLKTLKSAAQSFRAVTGGAIAKTASSSNETVATASVSNSAQSGTYSLTVSQLARGSTYSFSDRFASTSNVINASINNGATAADRTVTISTGQGSEQETVAIELTNTTKISDFVTQYNNTSTKSQATLVNVGTSSSPSYAVVISSDNTGLEKGEVTVTVGNEVQTAGSGAFVTASSTSTQAQNAQFTLSGIGGTIERGTNNVSDIIAGTTFNLASLGSTSISIFGNQNATKGAFSKFVEAYNDVVNFIGENDLVSQENQNGELVSIFGALSDTSIDENVLSQLRSSLVSVSSGGNSVHTLSDLGITTQRDGTLRFDETVFKDAFASDATGIGIVSEALGERLASVGGTIDQFIQFSGLIDAAKRGNTLEIDDKNDRITELEASLSKQQDSLTSQFSRLEGLIGRLTQQQKTLSSILPG